MSKLLLNQMKSFVIDAMIGQELTLRENLTPN